MHRMRRDRFLRGLVDGGAKTPQRITIVLPFLMLFCVGFLVLSRIGHSTIAALRIEVEGFIAPVMRAALVPFEPVLEIRRRFVTALSAVEQIDRLKAENQQLRQWQQRARELEERLADLSIQARVVRQQPVPFVTVRVMAQGTGPFAQSVLIDGGSEHGLRNGQPVINAYGLVGRIVSTGRKFARVLLLTDFTSRIPVVVGPGRVDGILIGGNSKEARLEFLSNDGLIEAGQTVSTSGVGGGLPSGMRLGTVSRMSNKPLVKLDAQVGDLQYLSVLFHESPTEKQLNKSSGAAVQKGHGKHWVSAQEAAKR